MQTLKLKQVGNREESLCSTSHKKYNNIVKLQTHLPLQGSVFVCLNRRGDVALEWLSFQCDSERKQKR